MSVACLAISIQRDIWMLLKRSVRPRSITHVRFANLISTAARRLNLDERPISILPHIGSAKEKTKIRSSIDGYIFRAQSR